MPEPLRPTVIGSGPAPLAPAPVVATPAGHQAVPPTSEPAPPRAPRPTALPRTAPAPARPLDGPLPAPTVTRVRGVERRGLQVAPAELKERHPQASEGALDQAVVMLAGVVPPTCQPATLAQLGRPAQEGVARLVDRVLRLVDEETSRTTTRHVERLLELLNDLAETLEPPSGLAWRRKTLRQALAQHRPELGTLRGLLESSEAQLREHEDRLGGLMAEALRLQDGLQGAQVALAELRPLFPDTRRARAIDEHDSELAKSLALLATHGVQMQRLAADFAELSRRIRDAVLHALPAWLALAASAPDGSLSDTDRFSLRDALQRVVWALSHAD